VTGEHDGATCRVLIADGVVCGEPAVGWVPVEGLPAGLVAYVCAEHAETTLRHGGRVQL
jgi:hypothetical protein